MEDIRVSSSAYGGYVVGEFLKSNAWWLILIIVIAALTSLYDYKFLLVTFMILLIVVPMIMSFVYFKYVLHPLSRYSILPKSIDFNTDNETLSIEILDTEGNIAEKRSYTIDEFSSVDINSSLVAFHLSSSRYLYLIFPISAFSKSDINFLMNKFLVNPDFTNQ